MKDIENGACLGKGHNWDNDLYYKIVDQKYKVEVKDMRELSGLNKELMDKAERLKSLGFEIYAEVQLIAKKEYSSPLMCLGFVNEIEKKGFVVEIEERTLSFLHGSGWQTISKEDLEKILKREREPVYREKVQFNPGFSISCDIGD